MAKIVNLQKKRKEVARMRMRIKADENALKFGRSKAQRELEKAQSDKSSKDLDAHRCDPK